VANPGNVPESRQSSPGAGTHRNVESGPKGSPRWVYIGAGIAAVAVNVVALYVIMGASLFSSNGPTNGANLDEMTLHAPGFSLPDQHGQTYTLTPGDGKNHLLVFYMGYF